jgi:lysophospholipase L1-like esterase
MKYIKIFSICFLFNFLIFNSAKAFDIYALGTSATNCKNVPIDKSFTTKLEEFIRTEGIDAHVINGGINGDKPIWMVNRVETVLDKTKYPNVKIVIFEPGPNDRNPKSNVESSEKVLAKLKNANMPTIYAAPYVQTEEEGDVTAKKFNAYYYGMWSKGVIDNDPEWRQFDYATPWGGHMTAKGCQKVAEQMVPLIKKIIAEQGIN